MGLTSGVLRRLTTTVLAAAALSLAACLPTKISTLAPNMVRLNLQGLDAPSDYDALKEVMLLAAKETLSRGYARFRFVDWSAGPAQTIAPGQPATANFAVTVVMFLEGEQGTNAVFDARQILLTQSPQQ